MDSATLPREAGEPGQAGEGSPGRWEDAGSAQVAKGLLDGGALRAPRWRQPEVSELVSRTRD